jgi:hypothetical protein
MTVALVIAVAAITVGSRVAALTVLPSPRGAAAALARRLPAPLFAALAALSMTGSERGVTDPALLAAVACALLVTRWSSLLLTLGAGLGGYLLASLVW